MLTKKDTNFSWNEVRTLSFMSWLVSKSFIFNFYFLFLGPEIEKIGQKKHCEGKTFFAPKIVWKMKRNSRIELK